MKPHTIYANETGKRTILRDYDDYLGTLPFEVERVHVDTRFGRTHTLVAGPPDGMPLLVLQGGNCINPMTLSWFAPLTESYRVYAPDTVGHPGYSAETRVSAQDASFAYWLSDLLDGLGLEKSAFIGVSYGGGLVLRLAAHLPERIACAVLVAPAGVELGSKGTMISRVLLPLLLYKWTKSPSALRRITDEMSMGSMKDIDRKIVGDIFTAVKLEQDMPKRTERAELEAYTAPTLVIGGTRDVFFPGEQLQARARTIIPQLAGCLLYDMGHFPPEPVLADINREIGLFLDKHYSIPESRTPLEWTSRS